MDTSKTAAISRVYNRKSKSTVDNRIGVCVNCRRYIYKNQEYTKTGTGNVHTDCIINEGQDEITCTT